MILKKENKYFIIENYHELYGFEERVNILNCFKQEKDVVLFQGGYKIDDEEIEFMKKRTYLYSNEYFGYFKFDYYPKNAPWFIVKTEEEICKALSISQFIISVIVKTGDDFSKRKYEIQEIEEDIGSSLYINEMNEGHFKKNVLPKIKNYLKSINIELDCSELEKASDVRRI